LIISRWLPDVYYCLVLWFYIIRIGYQHTLFTSYHGHIHISNMSWKTQIPVKETVNINDIKLPEVEVRYYHSWDLNSQKSIFPWESPSLIHLHDPKKNLCLCNNICWHF
jgi:hypothetical protein